MKAIGAPLNGRGVRTWAAAAAAPWRSFARTPMPLFERSYRRHARAAARPQTAPGVLSTGVFHLLVLGIVCRLMLSTGVLYLVHINYANAGGNPLTKINPGTYVILLATWQYLAEQGDPLRRLLRQFYRQPALAAFMTFMTIVLIYSVVNRLAGYLSILADTYLCAGMAAMLLSRATAAQLRRVGAVVLWVILLYAAVAVGETLTQQTLIPSVPMDGIIEVVGRREFRGLAFADGALGGAMTVMIGVFMLLRLRLPLVATVWRLGLLEMGLISFGGRTALAVTTAILLLTGLGYVVREIVTRRLRAEVIGMALIAATVLPLALVYLVTSTPMGVRIANSLYVDNSAQVRNVAWDIFTVLPWKNLILGTPDPLMVYYTEEIGIAVPYADLENCWIVLAVALGIIGFTVFLCGFLPFLWHLWKRAGARAQESAFWGHVMLLAFLLVASTSNSIGRKTPLLVVLTAAIYAQAIPRPSRRPVRRPVPRSSRTDTPRLVRQEPVFRGAIPPPQPRIPR